MSPLRFARNALAFPLTLLLSIPISAICEPHSQALGPSKFLEGKYVEYIVGNLPIVISAPHGGSDDPPALPERQSGVKSLDTNTQELARSIAAAFQTQTGGCPHVIICRVTRRKIDCNRDIQEGAQGNPLAEKIWTQYADFIKEAQLDVIRSFGKGFFVDLHGHGHPIRRLELGYGHEQAVLEKPDSILCSPSTAQESTLRNLAAPDGSNYAQLLRGPLSFGALMEKHGFPSTPSPSVPHPPLPYFSGGYNTRAFARERAGFCGLQIETNYPGVRDTAENRTKFANAFVETTREFLSEHLKLPLGKPQSENK
jgi:hypothetical protein